MGAETPINDLRIIRIGTLNRHGRAGWPQVLALQFQVRIDQLAVEADSWKSLAEAVRETEMNWNALCDDAERKLADDRKAGCNRESPEVLRARRLLDADASLERCWAEINSPRNRPTPQATIEAVLCAVRSRGTSALKEPANVARLSECDDAAKSEIDRRIAAKDTAR